MVRRGEPPAMDGGGRGTRRPPTFRGDSMAELEPAGGAGIPEMVRPPKPPTNPELGWERETSPPVPYRAEPAPSLLLWVGGRRRSIETVSGLVEITVRGKGSLAICIFSSLAGALTSGSVGGGSF
eukprot:COSAG01_NODE_11611_length_1894_cov_31.483565_3_plen_124_part_01